MLGNYIGMSKMKTLIKEQKYGLKEGKLTTVITKENKERIRINQNSIRKLTDYRN